MKKNLLALTQLPLILLLLVSSISQAQDYKEALKFLDRGMNDKALSILQTNIQKEGTNQMLWYFLGATYLKNGRNDSAKISFDKSIAVNSADMYASLSKAQLAMMQNGDISTALQEIKKADELSKSKNAKVLVEGAKILFENKKKEVDYAISLLEKASKLEPKTVEIYIILGDAFVAKQDGSKASTYYDKALQTDPKSASAYFATGILYYRARSLDVAKEKFLKTIELDPQFAYAYAELGDLAFKKQNLNEGTEYYKKYINLVGNDINGRIKYASYLFVKKEYNEVITEIEAIRKRDASNPSLLRLLGYAQYELGEYQKSQSILEDYFTKIDKDKIITSDYEYLAKSYEKNNSSDKAIEQYKLALNNDTSRVDLYGTMAELAKKNKNYLQAANFYRAKLKKTTTPTSDNLSLGIMLYNAKQWESSDSAFVKTIELNNTLLTPVIYRARIKANQDPDSKKGLAKPYYDEVLTKANNDLSKYQAEILESYNYMAFYYYTKKDTPNAKKYINDILSLDAKNSQALQLKKYYQDVENAQKQKAAPKK